MTIPTPPFPFNSEYERLWQHLMETRRRIVSMRSVVERARRQIEAIRQEVGAHATPSAPSTDPEADPC